MNMTPMKSWLGQVTTGIGALIATPAVIAWATGQITWRQAVPALIAAAVGLAWPENKVAPGQAQTVATDLENMIPTIIAAVRTHAIPTETTTVQTTVPIVTAAPTIIAP